MSLLTNSQKANLARLAAKAYAVRPRVIPPGGEPRPTTAETTAWRRDEVAKACGKHGLRCCTQMDYMLVQAHFLNFFPQQAGHALAAHVKAASEDRRQAEWNLLRAMKQWDFAHNYVEAISRAQNKCPVSECSAEQLWRLKYTIDARGRAKQKKSALNRNLNPSPHEHSHHN